jgi:anaerobic selenocysteine-containing dehydrogenase
LVSRRQVTANNATRYVPDERAADRPVVLVHADDASERGIEDGDRVEVASGTGHLTATARVGHGVRRGVVSLPHGWHGTNVCHLTDAGTVDPLTTQPQMSGLAVTVQRAGPPSGRPPTGDRP